MADTTNNPIPTLPAPVLDENSGLRPRGEVNAPAFLELLFSRALYRSSAFRLGLAISAIYLICFSIAWGLSYQFLQDGVLRRVDSSLNAHYQGMLSVHNELGSDAVLQIAQSSDTTPMGDGVAFQIVGPSGETIAGTMLTETMEFGWWTRDAEEMRLSNEGSVRFLVAPLGDNVVSLAKSLHTADELREDATAGFVKLFLISMMLGLLGSAYAAWRTHGRIDKITQVMRSVAAGQLSRRLPVDKSGDDINEFSTQINDALDRLQQNVDGLRQMSSDMAHELKTPLNRLYIQIEGATTKLYEQGIEVEELGKAMDEADYINSTFQAILRIAQIEAGARKAAFQPVNFIEVLGTVAEVYEPVVEEAGNTLQVVFDPRDAQHVMGDRELLMQVVVNLIENAIRHCPKGTMITLDAGEYHGEPWFRVADSGPGVPEEMREKLFQRMFRLEASRTTPGSGLGMTLVKAVADLHCASVRLEDNNPGLAITVKFEEDCPVC